MFIYHFKDQIVKTGLIFLFMTLLSPLLAQERIPVGTVLPAQQVIVHDPVMIKAGAVYYLFCTGFGISVWSSKDRENWKKERPVFDKAPEWSVQTIPGFKGHIWAPDISYHEGKYYLYYAVSVFGKNTSAIGLAVNKTLDPSLPDFKWEDKGKVIQSVPGRDMWNAIDPNEIDDDKGNHWLTFGSFWDGIKLVRLNSDLATIALPEEWYTIARRQRSFLLPDTVAGDAAIEAPFLFKKGRYYYLFDSWDYCCRGEKSTYKLVVGRSEKIQGPYVDKEGVPLNVGGGSTVLAGDKNWYGVGHNAVVTVDGIEYLIFHGYDAHDNGKPKLIIAQLNWLNDWPMAETSR
jgi:arabinan endo-1,5-alpha-L-arabinosidase